MAVVHMSPLVVNIIGRTLLHAMYTCHVEISEGILSVVEFLLGSTARGFARIEPKNEDNISSGPEDLFRCCRFISVANLL